MTLPDHPDAIDLRRICHPAGPPDAVNVALGTGAPEMADPRSDVRLRDALSDHLGVAAETLVMAPNLATLAAKVLPALVAASDHVALSEPCHPAYVRAVLGMGARYVDMGRDQRWMIRESSLERLIDDDAAAAVILGRPSVPSGASCNDGLIGRALEAGLWVLVDETHLAFSQQETTTSRSLHGAKRSLAHRLVVFDSLELQAGLGPLGVAFATAAPDVADLIRAPDPAEALGAQQVAASLAALGSREAWGQAAREAASTRDHLRRALTAIEGLAAAPSEGACLLVRVPGVSGMSLRDALRREGVYGTADPHPSWRDSVCLAIPLPEHAADVVAGFRAALAGLLADAEGGK